MNDLKQATKVILDSCQNPEKGLPEDVFLMISSLIPVPNVDLFVFNEKKEILLSWRKDSFFEQGWSLPGGCLRFGETMLERIQKTALREIGQNVIVEQGPLTACDAIRGIRQDLKYPRMRGHNIAVPYLCRLTKSFDIESQAVNKGENGYLQWFSVIPDNILPVHHVYDKLFQTYGLLSEEENA